MEKECVLYEKEERNKVRCTACAHRCLISEENVGICGVRKNIEGKLYLLVYGKIVSAHVDSIEKKPLYHFLPGSYTYSIGTVGCNFKCGFCQNWDISQMREIIGRSITPKQIVNNALKNNCKSVAYTYNEPTTFIEFAKDCAVLAKEKGLKNVFVTNGYMTEEALNFISQYIDAMNIDLKSFSESFYNRICRAKLKPVLETIKRAHDKGIHVEITTLIVPRENDSEKEFRSIARFISKIDKNIPWHISRFFPMYNMKDREQTPIETMVQAEKMGKKYLNYVYMGNV